MSLSLRAVKVVDEEALRKAIKEALEKSKPRRFRQSVDLIVSLSGLDLKKPENRIRAAIRLPHGPSKPRKIAMFAEGIMAQKAEEAGVDRVISEKELLELQGQKRAIKKLANQYDFFLAEPKMMANVGRVMGFALGPRGKIPQIVPPNADVKRMVEDLRRSVLVNVRNNPMVLVSIGHEEMDIDQLVENAKAFLEALSSKLPEKAVIDRIYVKTTMGPAVRVI